MLCLIIKKAVLYMFVMLENVLRLALAVLLAFGAGKLAARLKMPSVLGFLIAGMALAVFGGVLAAAVLTMLANQYLMPLPVLNFMLSGMVYSAVFANRMEEAALEETMGVCKGEALRKENSY